MSSPHDAVTTYILAKDGNRPHLMRLAFTSDVELEMVVRTDAITFPAMTKGLAAVTKILVRRFSTEHENVYTFALSRPAPQHREHFPCRWLVGMSAKGDGSIRVGCGLYDWYFTPDPSCLVDRLVITIDRMCVLPASSLTGIMDWLSALPYPWCTIDEALRAVPRIDGLAEIETYLATIGPSPSSR